MRGAFILSLSLVWPIPAALAASDPAETSSSAPVPAVPVKLFLGVVDTVLANQIDPPTRQQMILTGLKDLCQAAGVPQPAGLSRRVSALTSPEQFAALIEESWPRSKGSPTVSQDRLVKAFIEGALRAVPGGATLISAKEAKVKGQFQGNLYVGIHIALSFNQMENRPEVAIAFEGGPAGRAGVRAHDLIEEVDGKDTRGLRLEETVDRLRGEEGTDVEIVVRQLQEKDARRLKITRGRLPRATIKGTSQRDSGGWEARIDDSAPVAYLKIESINGSTPHELRALERQLEAEGFRALILDLRAVLEVAFHPTVLLADELLDGGTIGRARTADRVKDYLAQPDCLFRGWPLAVLVDGTTSGPAEWLAAALQDNHRAILIGSTTQGSPEVKSLVPVPGGEWGIEMVTQVLERGDGRKLAGQRSGGMEPPGPGVLDPFRERGEKEGGVTPDHKLTGSPPIPNFIRYPESRRGPLHHPHRLLLQTINRGATSRRETP